MKKHEVVIVGDGVIGLTQALALAQQDIDVALLMKTPAAAPMLDKQKYDMRVSAITQASQRIFQNLGVWPAIAQRRISPFRDMKVWDATGAGQIHFDSAWLGQAHLGHIIENSVMLAALQEKLDEYPNLHTYQDITLESILPADNTIILRGQSSFQTQLLIGADGAQSWIRQQAGVELTQRDYDHTAIVCTVQTQLPHAETAWQCFLPTGPLAFLPLNHPAYCSIVWSCTPERAAALLALDDHAFQQELADAFGQRLGRIEWTSPRMSFPLIKRHAKQYVLSNLALVGDAAHTIHPLAGQGMNMGLLDVAALVDTIMLAKQWRRPLGYLPMLRRYERERRSANGVMLQAMDGFKQLFSNTHPVLSFARNQGLAWTDNLPWLKNCFMHYAAGNQRNLPSLARETTWK